jgi:hypothetical protein
MSKRSSGMRKYSTYFVPTCRSNISHLIPASKVPTYAKFVIKFLLIFLTIKTLIWLDFLKAIP